MIFSTITGYLKIAAIVGLVLLAWSARGWYEDSKTKDALVTVIDEGNKQVKKDEAVIVKTEKERSNVEKTFDKISAQSGNGVCKYIPGRFLLWNKASQAANQAATY